MKFFSAGKYYFQSLFTIITGFKNWYALPLLFWQKPFLLKLKNGQQFYIETLMDMWILKEVILDNCYHRFFIPQKNWHVIDVGSSIADFSVYLSPQVNKIIGFDPSFSRNKLARKNLIVNNCTNVTLYPEKVSNLNFLFNKLLLKKIDLLKIDCEGAEYQIILNTKPVYLKKIKRIVGEYHLFTKKMQNNFPKMLNFLKTSGFQIQLFPSPVHQNIGFIFCQINQKTNR